MPVDSQKIHRHLEKISRLNTALAIASLFGVIVLYGWLRFLGQEQPSFSSEAAQQQDAETLPATEATTPEELMDNYQEQINSLLDAVDWSNSSTAEGLLYQVLELRVPAELKSMHLAIVVALEQAKQGHGEEAESRIDALKAEHAWFLAE